MLKPAPHAIAGLGLLIALALFFRGDIVPLLDRFLNQNDNPSPQEKPHQGNQIPTGQITPTQTAQPREDMTITPPAVKSTASKEEENSMHEPMQWPKETIINSKYEFHEFQAGMNLLVYGHPDVSQAKMILERLQELGVNSVAITFPFHQDHWQADQVYINAMETPDFSEIEQLILLAKAENLAVMLRPIMDEKKLMAQGKWRGEIAPRSPKKWFRSYYDLLWPYAELAQKTGVEVFNVGTEFNSMEKYGDEWINLIQDLRRVYHGKITYSFNWNRIEDIRAVKFASSLDYISLDAYFPLEVPNEASVQALQDAWKKWTNKLSPKLGKPVLITEAGMIPVEGAFRTPYAWNLPNRKLDWDAQGRYYEATFQAWRSKVQGLYWWCVPLYENDPDEIGYSPLGSPTEAVLKKLFANP